MPSGTEVIAGVAVLPLILGLVDAAKGVGLPTKFAPLLSLILGLLVSIGYTAVTGTPTAVGYYQSILVGAALGLGASGLYNHPAGQWVAQTLSFTDKNKR